MFLLEQLDFSCREKETAIWNFLSHILWISIPEDALWDIHFTRPGNDILWVSVPTSRQRHTSCRERQGSCRQNGVFLWDLSGACSGEIPKEAASHWHGVHFLLDSQAHSQAGGMNRAGRCHGEWDPSIIRGLNSKRLGGQTVSSEAL